MYPIINIRHENEGVFLRLVSEQSPHANAVSVQASLEDLYLYYFSEVNENVGSFNLRSNLNS